ncbi:hypothetical protein E6O75_ATG04659 [Venturia nashicola]|uniref:Uncharacterized protein n=1 Tax=Venturia nashicola TaxID=86259 RepID=A0A4Z1P3Y9_9PEZI|nr:hypothetical protein E6O75_ATG04659 [Venturia nashicola]
MPIRNPFKKSITAEQLHEQNWRDNAANEFQTVDVSGKGIEIKEPTEYQLSEINDSGVYIPPSPPPKERSFFSRSSTSTSYSTTHRGTSSENTEPFNISRESFDSYRRSFDISARSPIPSFDERPRQSLDSRRVLHSSASRPSFQGRHIDRPHEPVEEGFEEVGLNDEAKPKKRGLFSRFGDTLADAPVYVDARPASSHHNFLQFPGRKRGQSGQGAELSAIGRSNGGNAVEVGGQ